MNEEEMRKYIEEMSKHANMPKSIFLKVQYRGGLQEIVGREEDPVVMSEGSLFSYLLQNVFIEHPDIMKKYEDGGIHCSIDDTEPKMYTPLFDGDVVVFDLD